MQPMMQYFTPIIITIFTSCNFPWSPSISPFIAPWSTKDDSITWNMSNKAELQTIINVKNSISLPSPLAIWHAKLHLVPYQQTILVIIKNTPPFTTIYLLYYQYLNHPYHWQSIIATHHHHNHSSFNNITTSQHHNSKPPHSGPDKFIWLLLLYVHSSYNINFESV